MKKTSNYFDINFEHFDSTASMLAKCDAREVRFTRTFDRNRPCGSEFYRDYDIERKDFLSGVTADVKGLQGGRVKDVKSIKAQKTKKPVGYFPLVPRAIKNVPNCMRAKRKAPASEKIVHLLVECSYPWDTPQDAVMERGRELVAFIQASERAGYRIGVDAVASFARPENKHADVVTLTLKKAERALDIKRLSYPLLHAGFLRQICFDWYERNPRSKHIDGYGITPHLWHDTQKRVEFIRAITDKNTRYINLMRTPITEQLLHGGE